MSCAQDLLRDQRTLRQEVKQQQEAISKLLREVTAVQMERDTLLSIHKAMAQQRATDVPMSIYRPMKYVDDGAGRSLDDGGQRHDRSFASAGSALSVQSTRASPRSKTDLDSFLLDFVRGSQAF